VTHIIFNPTKILFHKNQSRDEATHMMFNPTKKLTLTLKGSQKVHKRFTKGSQKVHKKVHKRFTNGSQKKVHEIPPPLMKVL